MRLLANVSMKIALGRLKTLVGITILLAPGLAAGQTATTEPPRFATDVLVTPEGSETAASAVFRSTLAIVMITPGTVAPDESVTVPAMLPYTAWAVAGADGTIKARSVNHTAPRRCVTTERPSGAARAD